MDAIDSDLEETAYRFQQLTPRLHKDSRLTVGYVHNDDGIYYPFVYQANDPKPNGFPEEVIVVLNLEAGFQLILGKFFFIIDGVPHKVLPYVIKPEDLDDYIILIWESWINSEAAMNAVVQAVLHPALKTVQPL